MMIDNIRNKREFKKLYKECGGQSKNRKLRHILDLFSKKLGFCFYHDDNSLGGCIYIEKLDDKTYLSGFSRRKHFKENIEAVNCVCDWLKQDVYSETPFKNAIIVLKGAGFEHYKDNTYIRRYNNG